MKRLFYFVLLLAGFSAIHSCKDLLDENGDPLVDINNNSGLIGPRALYREITDADTIAEYHYNGLLLSKVITDSASITDVMFSGDKVSTINFRGFLDMDGDGDLEKDSIAFSQLFTYGNTGRLESISENRSIYRREAPIPPATLGIKSLFKKTKSIFNLKYNGSTAKLDSIIMKNGDDVSGTPFAYTKYTKVGYEYVGDNISKAVKYYGAMIGTTGTVFGTPTQKLGYAYSNYDTQISAYTLLPTAYKISALISTDYKDIRSLMLSPNNPKRISVTDLSLPIPAPDVFSTDYTYDAQTYVKKGFGINFIYKPL